jgi:putative copper resistance protein D
VTFAFAVVRALHFASLMTVFGACALLWQARGISLQGKTLNGLIYICALLAIATAVLSLGYVAQEMTGDPGSLWDLHAFGLVVSKSFYGAVFRIRIFLLLGLCLFCIRPGLHLPKALLAGAALALLGLTSHAAAAGDVSWFYARAGVDALHLVTAGFWVGGLAVLTSQVLAKSRDLARLVYLLRLFSRWGVVSVAVLIAAGTINAVAILGAPGMPWSSTYITWLAVKIVLAAVMVALALTNRFGVLPGLEKRDLEAEQTIPLTVVAELSCAFAILAIVGFLGTIAPMQM